VGKRGRTGVGRHQGAAKSQLFNKWSIRCWGMQMPTPSQHYLPHPVGACTTPAHGAMPHPTHQHTTPPKHIAPSPLLPPHLWFAQLGVNQLVALDEGYTQLSGHHTPPAFNLGGQGVSRKRGQRQDTRQPHK
jgi:hypothetical protein